MPVSRGKRIRIPFETCTGASVTGSPFAPGLDKDVLVYGDACSTNTSVKNISQGPGD